MPPLPRRLWDANVICGYLSGSNNPDIMPACGLIIDSAKRGEWEIVISTMSESEVAYLPGFSAQDAEARILEFLSRDYVIRAASDISVAKIARRLIRAHRPGLKGADAVHMATALLWNIPILETIDLDLLRLNSREGNPPLIIRKPLYEGTLPMFPPTT